MRPDESTLLLQRIQELHRLLRDGVLAACAHSGTETLSQVARDEAGDTLFRLDEVCEELLVDFVETRIATIRPCLLIAEGLEDAGLMLPRGTPPADAAWRIIVDPIDGTRGLMFQKRSAWILTGVAPNRGAATGLHDIRLAVQTEIPTEKQHLSDVLWAVHGQGVSVQRFDRISGETHPLRLAPSRVRGIEQGFATVSRFFPGVGAGISEIFEEIVGAAVGPSQPGKASCFEDQYICTGGQLYELMAGHDRFVADLRGLFSTGLCCHPYDLCTELIARESGIIVVAPGGGPLQTPLDLESNVSWVGYANEAIRHLLEPHVLASLEARDLL